LSTGCARSPRIGELLEREGWRHLRPVRGRVALAVVAVLPGDVEAQRSQSGASHVLVGQPAAVSATWWSQSAVEMSPQWTHGGGALRRPVKQMWTRPSPGTR
jgi:hypothetical protein